MHVMIGCGLHIGIIYVFGRMKAPILSLISHSATSYGTGIGAGYLFLTDRHLIFRVCTIYVVINRAATMR